MNASLLSQANMAADFKAVVLDSALFEPRSSISGWYLSSKDRFLESLNEVQGGDRIQVFIQMIQVLSDPGQVELR